jgi:hypothetical protein
VERVVVNALVPQLRTRLIFAPSAIVSSSVRAGLAFSEKPIQRQQPGSIRGEFFAGIAPRSLIET